MNSFHQAILPDSLHTWSKGLVENLISQTLICMKLVARLDKSFNQNLSMLDTNISAFPTHHTLNPWNFSRFPKGITPFSKKNKSKKEGTCLTGFFSGSIQACRLSGLLAQMLFSIPLDGSSLPTGSASRNFYADNLGSNQSMDTADKVDIQNTLIDSIVIALDYDMYTKAPFMRELDIAWYKELLSTTVFKFIKVTRMNSILSQMHKYNGECSESIPIIAKNPAGVKMHLLYHTVDNISRVGKEKSSTDTEITESYNKVVKCASQQGTQKIRTEGVEVIKVVNRQIRAAELVRLSQPFKKISEGTDVESSEGIGMKKHMSETIPELHFVVAKNCSHQNISFDHPNKTMVVEDKHRNVNGKRVPLLPLIHDLLSLDQLFKLLIDKFELREDRQLRLLNSIKCLGSESHGIEPFMLHANSNYNTEVGGHISIQSSQQDFGFVKLNVEDIDGNIDQFTALVMGIIEESGISVTRNERDRVIYNQSLIVCWLQPVTERGLLKTSIPYTQLQFTFVTASPTSNLWFDVMPLSSIKEPVFVIPIISSMDNYCFGHSSVQHKRKIKFFELNLERVIYWSAHDYDDFTEGNGTLNPTSSISTLQSVLLDQSFIENVSVRWRDVEMDNEASMLVESGFVNDNQNGIEVGVDDEDHESDDSDSDEEEFI